MVIAGEDARARHELAFFVSYVTILATQLSRRDVFRNKQLTRQLTTDVLKDSNKYFEQIVFFTTVGSRLFRIPH